MCNATNLVAQTACNTYLQGAVGNMAVFAALMAAVVVAMVWASR